MRRQRVASTGRTTACEFVQLSAQLIPAEPADRPAPPVAPTSYIDGVATNELDLLFPTEAPAIGSDHHVELRYGQLTVASFDISVSLVSCLGRVPVATSYQETLCEFASGDLRYAGDEAIGPSNGCIADAQCVPACFPEADECPINEHCTSRVVSTSPLASHLGCAPLGTKHLGDACELIHGPRW